MAIISTAGAAVLTSVASTVGTSDNLVRDMIARGLAEQLMDEIESARFPAATNVATSGVARSGFDDIDDYDGWSASPPVTKGGTALGTDGQDFSGYNFRLYQMRPDPRVLAAYRRSVIVERVESTGISSNPWSVVTTHTDYRRVTVTVSRTGANGATTELTEVTRILSYVPSS